MERQDQEGRESGRQRGYVSTSIIPSSNASHIYHHVAFRIVVYYLCISELQHLVLSRWQLSPYMLQHVGHQLPCTLLISFRRISNTPDQRVSRYVEGLYNPEL